MKKYPYFDLNDPNILVPSPFDVCNFADDKTLFSCKPDLNDLLDLTFHW